MTLSGKTWATGERLGTTHRQDHNGLLGALNNRGLDVTLPPYDVRPNNPGSAGWNRSAIQAAIDDHANKPGGRQLWFSGNVSINGPLQVHMTEDADVRLDFRGEVGRRGSRIIQQNNNENIFELHNTTQNIRGISIQDLALYGGNRAIDISAGAYHYYRNVSFMNQNDWSVHAANGSNQHWFDGCWWVHLNGNTIKGDGSTSLFLTGCQIGEDAGAIHSAGGVTVDGCHIYGAVDKINPDGIQGMGRATFSVFGGGWITVKNSRISSGGHLVNIDHADSAIFRNNEIGMTGDDTTLLHVRRHETSARFAPIVFVDNWVHLNESHRLWSSAIGHTSRYMQITDNYFGLQGDATLIVDDSIRAPELKNALDRNLVRQVDL